MPEEHNKKQEDRKYHNVRIFKHKTFQTLTEGMTLVKLNKFSGKISVIQKSGLKVNIKPWIVQKTYSVLPQKLGTPPATAYTADGDGSSISYDTDYMYYISDPKKFAQVELNEMANNNNSNVTLAIIGERLDNIVRGYVSRNVINNFIGRGNVDILNDPICNQELQRITQDYGITVTEMLITKIQFPKSVSDQMEANRISELKKKEAQNKKEAQEIEAEGKANVIRTTAKAESEKLAMTIKATLETVKQNGGNVQEMCYALGQKLANEGLVNGSNPNTTIFATNAVASAYQNATNNGVTNIAEMTAMLMAAMQQINKQNNNVAPNNVINKQNNGTNSNAANSETNEDDVDWERYLSDKKYADEVDGVAKTR